MMTPVELQLVQELTWNKHKGLTLEVWQFYLLSLNALRSGGDINHRKEILTSIGRRGIFVSQTANTISYSFLFLIKITISREVEVWFRISTV